MEFFKKVEDKAVRLKSHHNKFLLAADDETSLTQHGNGATTATRWTVEFVDESNPKTIRLKNLKTKMYLSASDEPFKRGVTAANKATQALPSTKSVVEWVPVKEGNGRVMLKTRAGTYLCGNGSFPPWRNSVTHDLLSATENVDWAIWAVEIVEKDPKADSPVKASGGGEELRRTCSSPANAVGGGGISGSPVGSVRSVRTLSPRRQAMDSIRRSSSTSSSTNTKVSNSFNNREPTVIDAVKPLPLEVRMAKLALMDVQLKDFNTVFSSDKLTRLESSISFLLSYNNPNDNTRSASNSKLLILEDKLQTLKSDKRRSTNELNKYEDFKEKKANMLANLQTEVAKARQLESQGGKLQTVLQKARSKRVELLRELGKVEREMKIAEEDQVKSDAEMEELCRAIRKKSEIVKEMEMDENVWVEKKAMAERRIKQVEYHWDMIKAHF